MNKEHEKAQLSKLTYFFKIFIELIEETNTDKSDNIFLEVEIMPWHHYYEMSKGQLISKFIEVSSLKSEAIEYIFSENQVDTAIEISKQSAPRNPPNKDDLSSILTILYAVVKNYESVLYHQKTIQQLLQKIKLGHDPNDNLIQKLLQIDKTIIYSSVIQNRVQKAQLENDNTFFKKLANVLKPRKKPEHNKDAQFTFMIFFLMDFGDLQAMSEKDKIQVLHKFKSPYISDESFARKIYKIMNLYY